MKNQGFTLIEILLSVALLAVFIPAITDIYSLSLFTASQGEKFAQANSLAQEQMEAIFYIKDNDPGWDWNDSTINTSPTEYYQPQIMAGNWQLGAKTSTSTPIDDFTKTVQIIEIWRDPGNHNITPTGTGSLDNYSRQAKVTVTWTEKGQPQQVTLESLVTQN